MYRQAEPPALHSQYKAGNACVRGKDPAGHGAVQGRVCVTGSGHRLQLHYRARSHLQSALVINVLLLLLPRLNILSRRWDCVLRWSIRSGDFLGVDAK